MEQERAATITPEDFPQWAADTMAGILGALEAHRLALQVLMRNQPERDELRAAWMQVVAGAIDGRMQRSEMQNDHWRTGFQQELAAMSRMLGPPTGE